MATGGMNLSREFFELLKAIGESKSKQEEDRIMAREVQRLKQKMETPPASTPGGPTPTNTLFTSKKQAKEFLVRLLYVSMLGHDNSWGLIRAVEMTASASLYHKRTGYLVCGACLPPDHEFRFMLVNQMQRDLQSSNILECCGGILACTSIITSDMVPAVAGEVTKLLSHDSATVRKKAIVCLHRFHQLAPEVLTMEELRGHVEKALCDKDPSVMGSCLNVMEAMAVRDPSTLKHTVPSLVAILKQIGDRRLPADYDYHRLPAPWMQMKLVRTLGHLGRNDRQASQGMYEILADCMKKADTGINAGYAVVYECIKTIVQIYPNPALLDAAAAAIARFIDSRSHNLRYLGVTGLAMIVEQHPQYAAQHQIAVMDCLEDPDETLQRKTLDLLYRMTNPVNIEFITEKLVQFISQTTDLFLKKLLTDRVCTIAERYAPSNAWYIQTITKLFQVSGDLVKVEVAQNLMSLLAEGTGDGDDSADMLLRQNAVEICVGLMLESEPSVLPRILLETIAWVLGEYGYLSAVQSLDEVLDQICHLARQSSIGTPTRKLLVQAIAKLVAQAGTCPPAAAAVMEEFTRSRDCDLQNRCLEFQFFIAHCPEMLPVLFPVDASTEDLQVDVNLGFLDEYVSNCLVNGARPYEKPEDDDDDDEDARFNKAYTQPAFKMTPYEKPTTPASLPSRLIHPSGVTLPPGSAGAGPIAPIPSVPAPKPGEIGLNTRNIANVWGKGGIKTPNQSAPASTSVPSTSSWGAHSLPPAESSGNTGYGSRGSTSIYAPTSTPPAPQPVVKTAEQLEKERQAAALFGGIVPGAPPPPRPAPTVTTRTAITKAAPTPPKATAAPAAPEVDLLDMAMWDTPAPAPAVTEFDVMGHATIVETVSEDENQPVTAPPPGIEMDPFASMLGPLDPEPPQLQTLAQNPQFEYLGTPMGPLKITTAQFGQSWGSCPATVPLSVAASRPFTLNEFMEKISITGAHPVEAITATNEGICAGMVGGSQIVLVHGRISNGGKIDATIKCTDQAIAGSYAMYLQALFR